MEIIPRLPVVIRTIVCSDENVNMQSITVKVAYTISTFFGAGRSPKAPGTVGSLAALPFAYALWQLPSTLAWLIVAFTFAIGVWASEISIRDSGVQDPGWIVIDEVVGIFIATCLCSTSLWGYAGAFALFRIFDIGKPYPISYADRKIKGGFGAMLDDAVAGGLAVVVYYVISLYVII